MNASRRVSLLFSAIFLLLFGTVAVHGAAFTPGNLVLYRMNNGAAALSANGTAVFLDEYTTAGALVQSIAVPTTTVGAQRRLVCSGTATTEGFLTRSTDGQYVVFSGYDAALNTASITTSTSATVPRVIGRVDANGTIDTSTALTDAISGGNPRSAASTNGTDLWLSGTSTGGGIRYATFGATTSTSLAATPTNLRAIGIFGGQLYTSSQSGAFRLATIGTGTPTTTGQTITNLPGFPTATGSPYGYFFADLNAGVAGVDTVYVADDGGTVQKYSLVAGNWTANGTIALATARGITGSVSGSNVTLYVTARTTLRTFTDTAGYNATINGTVSTLATAAANTAMQGVAFVPQGVVANQPIVPTCASPVTTTTGTATTQGVSATDADGTVTSATITGITPVNPGTITLTGFTPAGGVGGTANATLDVSAATPANTYSVTIQWANNDGVPQTANCVVSVVVNAPPVIVYIHDVQGNGAATPIPGSSVTIEGVVIGDFQPVPNDNRLSGFFVQEEDADAALEGDPATSEGIFVFCSACPTNVAEGQRVQVTGTVSEFFNNTQITASTAGSVVITNAGNNLAQVTPATIDLPVVTPSVDTYYEPMENMLVNYVDTLTVSEYFEQARYGRIELYEGARPRQFAEANPPSVAGYAAHLDNLNRRRVYIDDDDNVENSVLNLPNGQQFVFHPQANGGLSIGTQGTDFFRGGDLVNGLTGVLHWSFSGGSSPDEWRIRPTASTPATFTVANPRPPTPPVVGGAIRAASVNVLNYFTTLNQRGADSTAELNRQRERISIVLCGLNPDVAALMEIENHPTNVTINDLLGDVNTRCGGTHPYTFVNTGGALGTDQIRVLLIYRTGVLSPVGAALSDSDPVHNRPPTAQTFDVVDALNPAFGQRFTALANHSKSKGSCPGAGPDTDQNDGQACFAPTREAQANRIISWVNGTVIPAAGDPDVLLLGDFNANAQETATTNITSAGYTDLETAFLGANAYSYVFDGQIGHIDYAFSSASLTPQVTGTAPWHINADENPLFDYNDEIDDGANEQAFEEKPDGSALAPPRVVFQPASPYRASDHDPVLVGLFAISDLVITKSDSPDPVTAGNNLTYTITVTNYGPDPAASASWSDNLTDSTFVSLSAVAGWSCTTPAAGATGTINCTNPSFAVGSAVFTLTTAVSALTADGAVLSNTATVTSATTEGNPGDESDTETTTVAASADLSVSKADSPDPVDAGSNIIYTITVNNAGPSAASTVALSDPLPAGTTFVSLSSPGGWSCTMPAVGANGTVSCSIATLGLGNAVFTLVVNVDPSTASGASISNSATVTSTTSDPNSGNETGNSDTTVGTSADLSVTKSDSPDPVNAGANLTYTITVNNAGPSNASTVTLTDILPAETLFVSLASPGGWVCTTPGAFTNGTVSCSAATVGLGNHVFTLVVNVLAATTSGTVVNNSATVLSNATADPNSGNETGSAATTVATSANMVVAKSDSPDPVNAGSNITYAITIQNAGPSNAAGVTFTDTLPTGTTFVSFTSPLGWTCSSPAVGATGTVSCSKNSDQVAGTTTPFTLVVKVDPTVAAGTVISNTLTASSTTPDPTTGNESATATTTVATSADLSVTKVDTPDPVLAGNQITYTITVTNAGPSNAASVTFTDTVPAGTTFAFLAAPGAWVCPLPATGAPIVCTHTSLPVGTSVFTIKTVVDPATAAGTVLTNNVTVAATTSDPNPGNESDNASTTVATSANLSVTKTDSPDPVNAGSNLTYTITVNNAGPSNASTVNLSDTLPGGTTFVSLSTVAGWSCTTPAVGAAGTVSCSNASMGVGSGVFTLVVNVNASTAAGTVLSNSATVTSTTSDPATGNETGTATTTVATSADVSVTKVDTPDPVTAGTNITYTITVNNAGPSNAAGVALADTVPANTTFVSLSAPGGWSCSTPAVGGTGAISCSNASLAPGNAVFTLVVAVGAGVADGTVITNTATATTTTSDPNSGNDSGTATTTVGTGSVDLSVTKTDSPDPVTPGANLTYTITVNNAGPSIATSATLSDTLPAGTTFVSLTEAAGWSCTTPAVGAGGTVSCSNGAMNLGSGVFTLVVNVGASVAPATVLTNTATISSATTEANPGDESGVSTTTVGAGSADLLLSKTDSPDPVAPGSNIAYQITLTNNGPSNAASATFSDTLPAGTTFVSLSTTGPWTCTTPAVGATGTISCSNPSYGGVDFFNLVVAVDPSVAPGTVLSNTATLASVTADPNPGNESDTATTTVGSGSVDLSVTKTDSPDPVTPGENVTYTITVNNAGPVTATGVSLSDAVPAGTTFVSFTAAAGWTCTTPAAGATGTISCSVAALPVGNAVFTLVVATDAALGAGNITNTATVASATADSNPGNDSSTATTAVGAGLADLLLSKTDSPDPVAPGSNLSYQITITNSGPSNATSATFSDTLPAGTTFVSLSTTGPWTCTTPAVGAGGTVSCTNPSFGVTVDFFTLVVAVDPSVASGTVLSNTATITSATADPNGANGSSTTTTTVGAGSADLTVTKTDSPDPVSPGTNITYTITVANAGPGNAATVALSDTTPAGTTFVSLASPGGWTCTTPAVGGTGAISCSNASVAIGNAVFTLIVNVDPAAVDGAVITNTATVSSATADPAPGGESATAATTVSVTNADLSLTKVDGADPVAAGGSLTYTITVNNAGPDTATNVTMSDTLPAGTTFVSVAAPAGWTCTTPAVGANGLVSCTNPGMVVGNAVFTLVVDVAGNTPPNTVISNTASVVSTTFDPNGGGEDDTETTNVISPAAITGTKSESGALTPGSILTYTIVLTNSGASAQNDNPGNELTDVLPPQLTLISASASSGTAVATVGTNTVTWNGVIPSGSSVTITIQALIEADVPVGTFVTNQGMISYDANGDGINEASGVTDDPQAAGSGNPTGFPVGAAANADIPALDALGLAALAALLAGLGLLVMRRS
jgi:uncharacterized repeat protein (TIGR01451 family)